MNVDQFVAKYNGVHIDEDGYYGAQCWDVVARYAREVVGCPSFPTGSGGAEGLYRIFAQPIPQYFDRIANDPNDPNQIPQKGDVLVYQASFSPPYGHTALVISANSAGTTCLEQNGNNPGGVSYIKTRGWTGVSGWLRPKAKGSNVIPDQDNWFYRFNKLMVQVRGREISREEFRKNFVGVEPFRMVEIVCDSDEADRSTDDQNLGKLAKADNWQGQINDLTARLAASEQALRNREQQADQFTKQVSDLTAQVDKLTIQVSELVKVQNIKDNVIKDLQTKLALQGEDSVQLNKLGEFFRWAIKRLGTTN